MTPSTDQHYLKTELENLIKSGPEIWEFLQAGSLDGVWYWDLENPEDEWMSPEMWLTFGYDPAEMQHKASEWQDMIFQEDLAVALDNFNKHCADPNHPYDQIVRYRHKDGSTVWVRCRGVVIRNDEGTPIRMLGAHTNITSVKLAEEQEKNRSEQLEAANVRIEAQNSEIRDFAYSLSHDLKAPANTISIVLRELEKERDNLSDIQRKFLDIGLGTSARMLQMIEDLLTYTKVVEAEQETETIDLAQVIQDIIVDLTSDIGEDVEFIVSENLPELAGSQAQIRALLQNLIANAVKYTRPDTTPTVTISPAFCENPEMIGFYVEDNGLGIEQKNQARIFDMFKRLHREDEIPGTGLGLTICKRVVTNHAGAIELQSEVGVGSRFSIYLPRNQAGGSFMVEANAGIGKLVIIDDSEVDHFLAKHVIDQTGIVGEVISFLSAQEALEFFEEDPDSIDLILLDINMPVMDGFEFLEQVKTQIGDNFRHPVIVMLTTSLNPKDVDRANQYSFVRDYCNKPLDEDDLRKYAGMIEELRGCDRA